MKRNFYIWYGDQKIGCTQIRIGKNIECTIHGKSIEYPKDSTEAQLALCSIKANEIDSIFTEIPGEGSVSFRGEQSGEEAGQAIFEILPNTLHDIDIEEEGFKQTSKGFNKAGVDGISCVRNVYYNPPKPTEYLCNISWRIK